MIMDQESIPIRVRYLYRMLLEMANGNLAYRIPRSEEDDDIEAFTVFLNMVAEEMKESLHHVGYVNPHFTYRYISQSTFILDGNFTVRNINNEVTDLLGYAPGELFGTDFSKLLAEESLSAWENIKGQLIQNQAFSTKVSLQFIASQQLIVPAFCTVSRLLLSDKIIVTNFIAINQEKLEEVLSSTSAAETYEKEIRHIDLHLIQSVYDYILANMSKPLPTIPELSRMFNTNEYKLKSGFRLLFKTSIYRFYNDERLKRAHLLIEHTATPLKNIAVTVGFSTYPNFSRAFKIRYGYPPERLKRQPGNK